MKAALFDLDGVIVDSEGSYTKFWTTIAHEYGFKSTFAYDIKGTTLTDILNLNFDTIEIRNNIKKRICDYELTMEYPVFNGVVQFLDYIRAHGFKTAIVTSSDDTKMSYVRAQHPDLVRRFDTIITGSMVKKSKPDPEGYLLAARKLNIPIKDCYVFEDSYQGLEAGIRSGATVIALATTNPREELKKRTSIVIDSFAELMNFI